MSPSTWSSEVVLRWACREDRVQVPLGCVPSQPRSERSQNTWSTRGCLPGRREWGIKGCWRTRGCGCTKKEVTENFISCFWNAVWSNLEQHGGQGHWPLPHSSRKLMYNFCLPQNLTTDSLLLTRSLTNNISSQSVVFFVLYITYCTLSKFLIF